MRTNRGLSLIEVLVALAIFSIMGVAVTGIFVQGLQVRRQNVLNTQAQAYANLVLEQYKSAWSDPTKYETHQDPSLPPAPKVFEIDRINRIDIDVLCAYLDGSTKDDCDADDTPPLRRVHVKLIDYDSKLRADLVTDIGKPRP